MAFSQVVSSSSPVSRFRISGAVSRSGEETKSKLPERPLTHSRPWLEGPSAAATSTMRLPRTTRSNWQPVAQWGQVVRTRRTSQLWYSRARFSVSAPVGQAAAQLPQDSQAVAFQPGPKGASTV